MFLSISRCMRPPVTAGLATRSRSSRSRCLGVQVAAGPALTTSNKDTIGTHLDATASDTAINNGKADKATEIPSSSLHSTSELKGAATDTTSGSDTSEMKVSSTITLKKCQLDFLDEVKIVGEDDYLGAWAVDGGIGMQWREGHDWVAEVDLSPNMNAFKMVIVHPDGSVEWEKGNNREIQIPSVGVVGRLAMECEFNKTAETAFIM